MLVKENEFSFFLSCRYSDSICLKFYENSMDSSNGLQQVQEPSIQPQANMPVGSGSLQQASNVFTIQNNIYDLCNCINVSYTPRQIMSATNFIQVRFKTVKRSFDTSADSLHSKKPFRGYLIRYRFTRGEVT